MLTTYNSCSRDNIVFSNLFTHLSNQKNGKKFRGNITAASRGSKNSGDISGEKQKTSWKKKIANSTFIAQSAIAVLGLGFIDAGYSGDWSRIGVLSKGDEDLLKILAFLAVPLCLFLIFSLSRENEA